MASSSGSVLGRALFIVANLFYSVGSFAADFNETHVYNPRWPPHARFHNGQTMTLSVFLALASLYLFFRRGSSLKERQHDLFLSSLIGSFYCSAGLCAILYPGTDWADPESQTQSGKAQLYAFSLQVVIIWLGYYLESSSIKVTKAQ